MSELLIYLTDLPHFVDFYDNWLDSSTNNLKKLRKIIEKYSGEKNE